MNRRVVAGLLLSLGLAAQATGAPTDSALPPDSVFHVEARLVDQDAQTIAWRDTRGRPQLVSMFYTSCRYVCPLIVDSAKGIEQALSPHERKRLGIVLISMDPVRDTPDTLKRVAVRRKVDLAQWRLLQPAPEDVRTLAAILGIRYRALADGEFNHTSTLVLLDEQGRIVARTERLGAMPNEEFLATVKSTLASSAP